MLSIIVAMDKNRLIGKNNQLPWHLPADLAYFKKTTMGKSIVMGRKTYESIGRALPGRKNMIITRNQNFHAKDCTIMHSVAELLTWAKKIDEEIFIIGGAEIFKSVLPHCKRLYITKIDHTFVGDTYFPLIQEKEWKIIFKEKGLKDEKNPYDYYFMIYERITM